MSPSLGRRRRSRRRWTLTTCSSAARSASRRCCWFCQRTRLAGHAASPHLHTCAAPTSWPTPRRCCTAVPRGLCSYARGAALLLRPRGTRVAAPPPRVRGAAAAGRAASSPAGSTSARATQRGEGRLREEGTGRKKRGGAAGYRERRRRG
ncbi:hypothetical protein PAHAL_5G224900 [Panicum hallii]|uniref:Uncharacterized protein n=1 Tax=Panicum hallii TaxID=206008 RepID=A0A2T8IKV7_9POAL|nr:hypothetical protein PAHAL_5G224900 [Panicum hallii]